MPCSSFAKYPEVRKELSLVYVNLDVVTRNISLYSVSFMSVSSDFVMKQFLHF